MENRNLEQIYNRYKSQIYSLCIKLTMSKEFSEDLLSDTWVKVAEKLDQLDPGQNPFNWIYTICLNIYRKQKRKRSFIQFFQIILIFLKLSQVPKIQKICIWKKSYPES